jgi:hypothetical protein
MRRWPEAQSWAKAQGSFAQALLDPALDVPRGLMGPDGETSASRFAVYRNNVVVGLVDALQAAFPAVCRIVGEEFFRAMARVYVAAHPPASPILLDYGGTFPDFVGHFEPAGSLPYLPDVARIERAWSEAYHARDADPIAPQALSAIPADRVPDLRLALHPSLRVVHSEFPALTIWRMNVADGVPAPVDLEAGGEDALVIRPAAEVEVRWMPAGGAEFIAALAEGGTLAAAATAALDADEGFDLATNLAELIRAGAFVGFTDDSCRDTAHTEGRS